MREGSMRAGGLSRRFLVGAAVAVSALLGASVLPVADAGASGGTLVVAEFNPFSGPTAAFGPEMIAACDAAISLINKAGGVLGHHLACKGVDTHGDPADAVPAAEKMIATTNNLVGVIGPSSDEALATVPILNRAGVPMMADTGQAAFTKTKDKYFWRVSPADRVKGYAMALYAQHHHDMRAALVFGDTAGAQSDTVTLLKGYKALGGKVVINLKLAREQPSYNTEVEALLAAHPDVIFTEADPATSATFFSDLKQLNHTKLMPIIGSETSLEASWIQAVQRAVGGTLLKKYQVGVQPYSPPSGPAYHVFKQSQAKVKGFSKTTISVFTTDPYAMGYYDSVNIYALAMLRAHSTKRSVFNRYIDTVANPGHGKVIVHTFAQGAKDLKAGKKIEYYGASGQIAFNKWHNSTGAFEVAQVDVASGSIKIVDEVSAAAIAKLGSRA